MNSQTATLDNEDLAGLTVTEIELTEFDLDLTVPDVATRPANDDTWRAAAACNPTTATETLVTLFFEVERAPKRHRQNQTMDLVFEPGQEAQAKAICHTCPVQADCLVFAIDNKENDGIWGGATTHERDRLASADTGTRAALDQIAAEYTPAEREALNQAINGLPPKPSDDTLRSLYVGEGLSMQAIGERYGRSATTIRNWLVAAKIEIKTDPYSGRDLPVGENVTDATPLKTPKGKRSTWTQAIFCELGDGDWHLRDDLMEAAVKHVPRERALAKAKARDAAARERAKKRGDAKPVGFGKTDPVKSAAVWLVNASIDGLVRKSKTVEQRTDENGRKVLRLVG